MSEDITFKLQADETGALNALKRVRNEVLNNESGLKKMGQQARIAGKSLKDSASVLGPEFSILGDRIDHITGALGNVKGASLLTKASLVGLVAVGGFQVGQMIGNWVFETDRFKQELEEATKQAGELQKRIVAGAASRAATMTQEQLQKEISGTAASIARLTEQVDKSDQAWSNFSGADYWVVGENNRRKEVEITKAQIANQRELMKTYQDAMKARAEQERQTQEAAAAKAIEEERKAAEAAAAAAARLIETQEDYLFTLEAELVKVREGEEAYTRLTLAKKGFNEETINAALAMKAEITEISELKRLQDAEAAKRGESGRDTPTPRAGMPGPVSGTETRFITRGIGMKGEDKILAETQKQTAKTAELVTVNKQLLAAIKAIKVA
jgi:hypothetical protein